MQRYLHYLQTGSGSDRVEIQLDGEVAVIGINQCWMEMGPKQYRLTCGHRPRSEHYGLFVVERVEAAAGEDGALAGIELDEEAGMVLPLVIEYVTVPRSPVYVHGHSQLSTMRPLGSATWNDAFDLALMVHDFDGRAQEPPLTDICDALDKKKFALWTEAMEAEQAERERSDAEASLNLWRSILESQAP